MEIVQIRMGSLTRSAPVTEEIVVGKDVLELVAGAMYVDPLTVYREYIQNAADAIDEARNSGAIFGTDSHVMITLDHAERSVKIRDVGIGIRSSEFVRRLTAIGASCKRGTKQRGFRGVGRLSGLGYCQELIFRSRSEGDSKIRELRWDSRGLREKLRDPSYLGSLSDLIRSVTTTSNLIDDGTFPAHFFEVEMRKVIRIKNDLLMNENEIRTYLAQVAPVPFASDFKLGRQVRQRLSEFGVNEPIGIELNDDRGIIYHRAVGQIQFNKQTTLTFDDYKFVELKNSAGEVLAVGWLLEHGYLGAMPRTSNLGGIRLRLRDVQVGDSQVLAPLFTEQRFCTWPVGELHVVHPRIVPNGRRDDFEYSAVYAELQDELRRLVSEISQTIRNRSETRQRAKRIGLTIAYAKKWAAIAQRKTLHETIRRAALEQAEHHSDLMEKYRSKMPPDTDIEASVEKIKAQIKRLNDSLYTKRKANVRVSPGCTKSALAAVSAILSSTLNADKTIPMAERVLAAMEGRLK